MTEHTLSKQFIDLSPVQLCGKTLDVGGGGEAVISRRAGDGVVAIDWRKDELEETPDIGMKIVMDACHMGFLDKTFDNITSFYTMMYMNAEHVVLFLQEAYRVLKPGGFFWVWDTEIPCLSNNEIVIVPVEAKLNAVDRITTSYGIGWCREQTVRTLETWITDIGFTIERSAVRDSCIELCCRRGQ